MTQIYHKLEEAKFFFRYLEVPVTKYPEFDYFLSAFISSARSVLWVMRAQYHEVPGWESWFKAKGVEPNETTLLAGINDARIRSEKKKPLETTSVAIVNIPAENVTPEVRAWLTSTIGERVELILFAEGDNPFEILRDRRVVASGKLSAVYRRLEDFPDDDIVEVCRRYILLLDAIVKECSTKFGI